MHHSTCGNKPSNLKLFSTHQPSFNRLTPPTHSHSPPFYSPMFSSVSCIATRPGSTLHSSIFPFPIKSVTAFWFPSP